LIFDPIVGRVHVLLRPWLTVRTRCALTLQLNMCATPYYHSSAHMYLFTWMPPRVGSAIQKALEPTASQTGQLMADGPGWRTFIQGAKIFDPIVGRVHVLLRPWLTVRTRCALTLQLNMCATPYYHSSAHMYLYLDAASRGQRNSEGVGAHSQPNGPADG